VGAELDVALAVDRDGLGGWSVVGVGKVADRDVEIASKMPFSNAGFGSASAEIAMRTGRGSSGRGAVRTRCGPSRRLPMAIVTS
jgi:hypothetical protein